MRTRLLGFLCFAIILLSLPAVVNRGVSADPAAVPAATPTWARKLVNYYVYSKLRQGMSDSAGGLVAVGDQGLYDNLDCWAIHVDKDGKIVKQMKYAGKQNDRLYSVCASDDGGFMAAGRTQFEVFGSFDQYGYGLLMKLDPALAVKWAKTYVGLKDANYMPLVIKLKSTGYLAILYTWGGFDSGVVVVRLDSTGKVVWARMMEPGDTYYLHEINELLEAADGSLYLVGTLRTRTTGQPTREDGLIIKTDANGNLLWSRSFGKESSYENFYSAFLATTGEIMVFGRHYTTSAYAHGLFMKIDSSGNIKSQNTYNHLDDGFRYGFAKTGGGFYCMGTYNGANSVQFLFVKGDSAGKVQTKRSYAAFSGPYPNYYEMVADAFALSDGGIAFLDQDTATDGYVCKLDLNGVLPSACRQLSVTPARSTGDFQSTEVVIPFESTTVTAKSTKMTAKPTNHTTEDGCH